MDIAREMSDRTERINAVIEAYLPKEEGMQRTIMEAMNYSVRAGGKRLRPMLMEAAFTMFGGQGELICPFMAAIEMIHTYSLVHDDLPAMDDDEYRRGKKTTHAVYGEAMGILAGDGLLNYAYETAAKALAAEPENPNIGRAFCVLAGKAGIYGMVGGQVVDVESEQMHDISMNRERLDLIYRLKTGALIEASLMIGAILAGAKEPEIRKMERAGELLGMAFQIQDDILDVTGTTEKLGKPVGSDEKNHKVTYVTIEGITQAAAQVERLSVEAVKILNECEGEDSAFLQELFLYLIHRES